MKNGKGYHRDINPDQVSVIDRNWYYHALKSQRRSHFTTKRKEYKIFLKKERKLYKYLDLKKYHQKRAEANAKRLNALEVAQLAQMHLELELANRPKVEEKQTNYYKLSLYTV